MTPLLWHLLIQATSPQDMEYIRMGKRGPGLYANERMDDEYALIKLLYHAQLGALHTV